VLQEAFTAQAKAIGSAAGYAWQVQGPYARSGPGNPVDGNWYLGETQAAMLDSGLAVFSDYPVLAVQRMAFPEGDCAGFDCLAAKGVLLVMLDVPGTGPVTVVATHLNSRKASGAPFARANGAYARQAAFLGKLLRARDRSSGPLIVAGDFNRGDRPSRVAALNAALDPSAEALGRLAATGRLGRAQRADFSTIRQHGRDMQFALDGPRLRVEPVAAEVPFGTELDGTMLSDHLGYVVRYRLIPDAPRPVRRAASTR
jgi:endonuclease/exonuclease/phosphatase family metal-dependent hydrolase